MANILEMIEQMLAGGQQPTNRLAAAGGGIAPSRFDGPGSMGDPGVQAFLAGQGGLQSAPQAFAPSEAPQGQPAPAPVQQDPAQSGGGFLQNLFNPGARAQNEAVQWLQSKGYDPGAAQFIAGNKELMQKVMWEHMKGADPMDALQREKLGLEIENMRNPKPDYITGRDGSIFQTGPDGVKQVYGGKPDQPTDVQEYEYAKGQGYEGTFQEFQIEQKRAGASQVNIDQKAEGAFDKKLAEKQAETFDAMSTEGMNAKADIAVIGELEGLLQGQGGTMTGLSGYLAKYGIGGEGISDIQAAGALINKLVPTQRQPGSGSMSDRDVELFTRSLPSLWNSPGGNEIILRTMKGLAEYKQSQGEIADMVLTGEISRQEARWMLRELPNPLAEFSKKTTKLSSPPASATPAPAVPSAPIPAAPEQPPEGVVDWRDFMAPGRSR